MFQLDLKNIIQTQRGRLNNLAILLLTNIFTAGIGFVTTVTIANTLGSAQFGEVAYALAIGGILAVNVRFGMDRSLIRDLTHFPERFNEILAASILARGLLLILCTIGLLALMALPFKNIEISLGMFFIILATAITPMQLANVFDIWEHQGRHSLYGCIQKSIYFVIIWTIILWDPKLLGIIWIGSALLISTLFFVFIQYQYAWKQLKSTWHAISLKQTTSAAFLLLINNKWLWMASLAALCMSAINSLILKHAAGFSDLGIYAASFQLVSLARLLLKNIARIGRPILARYTIPDAHSVSTTSRFLIFYLTAGMLAVSIIALPAIAVPKIILEKLFIPEYAHNFWVLRIFGIYLLFCVFDTILGQYIILKRMDKIFFTALLATGLISVTCSVILAPRYGAAGAAVALLAGEVVLTAMYILTTLFQIRRIAKT